MTTIADLIRDIQSTVVSRDRASKAMTIMRDITQKDAASTFTASEVAELVAGLLEIKSFQSHVTTHPLTKDVLPGILPTSKP